MLSAYHLSCGKRITQFGRLAGQRRFDCPIYQVINGAERSQSIVKESQCSTVGPSNLVVEPIEVFIDPP